MVEYTKFVHIVRLYFFRIPNELKDAINDAGLEISKEESPELSAFLFQSALRFMTEAKLAPEWNRVEHIYAHNADFLTKETIGIFLQFTSFDTKYVNFQQTWLKIDFQICDCK